MLYMVTLCNMDPINIPPMLAYIAAPWIRHGIGTYLSKRPRNPLQAFAHPSGREP